MMIIKDTKVLTVKHDHCHYIFELLYSTVIFSFLGHFLEVVLVPVTSSSPNHRALQTPPPDDSDVAGAPQRPRQSPAPVMSPASWCWCQDGDSMDMDGTCNLNTQNYPETQIIQNLNASKSKTPQLSHQQLRSWVPCFCQFHGAPPVPISDPHQEEGALLQLPIQTVSVFVSVGAWKP